MAARSANHQTPVWRRASACSPAGDNCVEVRHRVDAVDIRDSKSASGQVITVGAAAWRSFVAALG